MSSDETAIRSVVAEWQRATAAGEVNRVLELMTDDVVFLIPGQSPMRGKRAFAEQLEAALQHVDIEAVSELQEIEVTGDAAYTWSHLSVTMTPKSGGMPKRHSGYTLTVYRRNSSGAWQLARDANMLSGETE